MTKKQYNKTYRTKAMTLGEHQARKNKWFNQLMMNWPAPKPKNHATKILLQ